MPHHFEKHLLDAIAVNRERAAAHAARSGGRSRIVSVALVGLERALLPMAAMFDRRAGERLAAAFVPMEALPAADRAPRYRSGGSARAWWQTTRSLGALRRVVAFQVLRRRATAVPARCERTLAHLDALEATHRVHLSMSRHIVESVALAASQPWAGGRFGQALVVAQLWGTSLAPILDALAWSAQAAGAGILVNDLPCCWPPSR